MNVNVVHVLPMVMGIGERGEDCRGIVNDVAVIEDGDGSGGHVVLDDGEKEEEREEEEEQRMGKE